MPHVATMATRTTARRQAVVHHRAQFVWNWQRGHQEIGIVAGLLLIAAVLRLVLAARGWPYLDSDEATVGLMAHDILHNGAHPLFFYGQDYLGALQAYLAVPFFALIGTGIFALRATTTAQALCFLLVLYAFTRAVYSRRVALCTLALLALGPSQALYREMQAGVGAQDTLVLGALWLWLIVLRLRATAGRRAVALDVAIGLTAGLALWCEFLVLPFLAAGAIALVVDGRRRPAKSSARRLAAIILPALFVLTPFLFANVQSGGATFAQVFAAAGVAGSQQSGLGDILSRVLNQVVATLTIGMPRILGAPTVGPYWGVWPFARETLSTQHPIASPLFALPFSLGALACWVIAAKPLSRAVWMRLWTSRVRRLQVQALGLRCGAAQLDSAACGWALLVIGGGLTVLEYACSHASALMPYAGARYLVGVYLCTPLVVAPLLNASTRAWRWLRGTVPGTALTARWRAHDVQHPARAVLGATVLAALFALHGTGAAAALSDTRATRVYGVPAPARDAQLLTFLHRHGATHFYTTYWTCYRLMLESEERVTCGVTHNRSAFRYGTNRVPGALAAVQAAPHPAYVFELVPPWQAPIELAPQMDARLRSGDARFAGYTTAHVAGCVVYYFAGAAEHEDMKMGRREDLRGPFTSPWQTSSLAPVDLDATIRLLAPTA